MSACSNISLFFAIIQNFERFLPNHSVFLKLILLISHIRSSLRNLAILFVLLLLENFRKNVMLRDQLLNGLMRHFFQLNRSINHI
jgi:hypothetical protein